MEGGCGRLGWWWQWLPNFNEPTSDRRGLRGQRLGGAFVGCGGSSSCRVIDCDGGGYRGFGGAFIGWGGWWSWGGNTQDGGLNRRVVRLRRWRVYVLAGRSLRRRSNYKWGTVD
jgi:hypothetical protein